MKKNIVIITSLIIGTIGLMFFTLNRLNKTDLTDKENTKQSTTSKSSTNNTINNENGIFNLFGLNIKENTKNKFSLFDYTNDLKFRNLEINSNLIKHNSILKISIRSVKHDMSNRILTEVKDFSTFNGIKYKIGLDLSTSKKTLRYIIFEDLKNPNQPSLIEHNTSYYQNHNTLMYIDVDSLKALTMNKYQELIDENVKLIEATSLTQNALKPEVRINNIVLENKSVIGREKTTNEIKITTQSNPEFYQKYNIIPIYSSCNGLASFSNLNENIIQLFCDDSKIIRILGFDYPLYINKNVVKGQPIALVKVDRTLLIE